MPEWSHVTPEGDRVRMVHIGEKPVARRRAWAEGYVRMSARTVEQLQQHGSPKGPILATARIAGIQAAKSTGMLIPLCHPLPIHVVDLAFAWEKNGIRVEACVETEARTGVEMEALTAVAVACLTIYDMCKSVDPTMTIDGIRLLRKEGGRSGVVELAPPRLLPPGAGSSQA